MSYEGSGTRKRAVEQLEWKNPRSRQLRKIVVRYARGPVAPKTVHRGHGVHLGKRRAQSARLTKLVPNAGYSVSIFAVYRNGHASRPAVVRFTTPGVAPKSTVRGTLRGVVTDSTGARLVRAEVSAFDFGSERSVNAVTNADGAYVLGLPPGDWSVNASGSHAAGGNSDATGYTDATRNVVIRGNRTTVAPTLALPAGAAVSGRIVNIAKQPVAGAVPYLGPAATYDNGSFGAYSSDLSFFSFDAGPDSVTGPDGRFELRGIPAGQALALCGVGQDVRVAGKAVDLLSGCQRRTHAVAAGHTLTLPDLALRTGTGSVVSGQLRNAKGRGLAGVVQLEDASGDDEDINLYAYTDAAGRYRLPGVARGRYRLCGSALTSAGSRTGYTSSCTKRRVASTGSGSVRANRTLQRGAAATGTVVGPRSNRLAGIRVAVFGDGGSSVTTTNSLGQWRAVGLGKGKYGACFSESDAASAGTGVQSSCWHGGGKFTVRVGRVRSGINAKLRAAAAVAGVVRDHTGKPVPYAEVTVATPQAIADGEEGDEGDYGIADAAGRCRVTGLDNGTYRVCASDPYDFATSAQPQQDDGACGPKVRARTGATTTAPPLVLSPATAVVARVVDSTGTPVAGADVTALRACGSKYCARTNLLGSARVDVIDSEITGADGSAVLAADPGRYAFCALGYFGTTVQGAPPTGYADTCHGAGYDVTVRAHATTTITITLADGGAVTGRVVDQTGRGVAGTRIVVPGSTIDDAPTYYYGLSGDVFDDFDDDGPSFDPVLPSVQTANGTDSAGRFEVIGVRPGRWSACATDNGSDKRPRFADTCSGGAAATVTVTADTTTTANITVRR